MKHPIYNENDPPDVGAMMTPEQAAQAAALFNAPKETPKAVKRPSWYRPVGHSIVDDRAGAANERTGYHGRQT